MFRIAWFPAWPLVAFGSGAALTPVFVLGCFAGYAAGHSRIVAV